MRSTRRLDAVLSRDSQETAMQDLQGRAKQVVAREKQIKEQREELMDPRDVQAKRAEEKKEAEQTRKVPTLRRKGEVPAPPAK